MARVPEAARTAALEAIFSHLATEPAGDDPLSAMRAHTERYSMGQTGPGGAACREVDVMIGDLPARWFVPPDARSARRHVHLHGGGWIAGSISSHRGLLAELAVALRMPVLAPAYRLAPEHPFPAGLTDATRTLDYARTHDPSGQAAEGVVTLSGDSAGGNLAAAATLRSIMRHEPGPARLALVSPFLALDLGRPVFSAPTHDPIVQQDGIDLVGSLYAPETARPDPLIEPLRAAPDHLAGFPQVLVQVSAAENLREQAFAFANALWSAGAPARLSLWPDVPHVWHVFLETLPDARAALTELAAFLSEI